MLQRAEQPSNIHAYTLMVHIALSKTGDNGFCNSTAREYCLAAVMVASIVETIAFQLGQ